MINAVLLGPGPCVLPAITSRVPQVEVEVTACVLRLVVCYLQRLEQLYSGGAEALGDGPTARRHGLTATLAVLTNRYTIYAVPYKV